MRILAVDPGLNGTGWAIFYKNTGRLIAHGVIKRLSITQWYTRGLVIASDLDLIQNEYDVKKSYIEFPSLFQSAHGQMVARKGDLVKLAWFTGLLFGRLIKPNLIPVPEWKGQLPKEVVKKRIIKILGKTQTLKLKDHDWDAVGIGLYISKKF